MAANKLRPTKTEFMIIGSRPNIAGLYRDPILKVLDSQIERVSSSKILGTVVDEDLSWHEHIEKISKKSSSGVGILRRLRPFVSRDTLEIDYRSLILSHLDYCCNRSGIIAVNC